MTLQQLLAGLEAGEQDFEAVQAWILAHYDYTPAGFVNGLGEGAVSNPPGTNEGSCRLFAFALDQGLDAETTLRCFGRHYRHVLADPAGSDHANIRQFMRHGWAGIRFEGLALVRKTGRM